MNLEGKMLAHFVKPKLTEKKHCLLITDHTCNTLFVRFVNLAKQSGDGWVEYMCPRPGRKHPARS